MRDISIPKFLVIFFFLFLAASPFGILGHELWHVFSARSNGVIPTELCYTFEDSNKLAYVTLNYRNATFNCDLCWYEFLDEPIAYILTFAIIFLIMIPFAKLFVKVIYD